MIIFFLSEDATCNDKIVKAGVNGPFFHVSHLFSASTVGVPNAIYHCRSCLGGGI